ncbi:hypothetical protein KX01_465 [Francisella frigiditurris]|uniref:Uncharacterized protein n=2 Tax=Francisellaceae TaxID=34064 RepID=A0A1J0KVV6_9GAMM|nr:hypothetical protein KX01_465 [Francisella frigiditurris]
MVLNFIMLFITAICILIKKNRWAVLFFLLTILVLELEFIHHATDPLGLQY